MNTRAILLLHRRVTDNFRATLDQLKKNIERLEAFPNAIFERSAY